MKWKRLEPEPNTYHVTTLTRCLAQSYFERTSSTEESVESAWSKLRGSLLHYVGKSLGWNELRVKMTFEDLGQPIIIIGYIDAYEPETATIFDVKTTRFVKWQDEKGFIPRDSHTLQVQCYYTLLCLYGIPVKRLVLVYVDDKTIVAKQVSLVDRRDWIIDRAKLLHNAFKGSQLPYAEVSSSCSYCLFVSLCPKHNEAKVGG